MAEIRIKRVPEELKELLRAEAKRLGMDVRAVELTRLWGLNRGDHEGHYKAPREREVKEVSNKLTEAVREVWEYYMQVIGRNPRQYTLTEKRRRMGLARVKELLERTKSVEKAVAVMKLCVDRLKGSGYHNGKNEQGKKYLDWEILFRSTDKLEFWLDDERWK